MSMLRFICFTAAAALMTGCSSVKPPELVLTLAVNDIYCQETACACVHYVTARTYGDTQERLRDFGIELQLDYYPEPYNLEKAILSGRYDGVLSKPWTALMLEQQAGTEFEQVVDLMDPGTNRWLMGIVVVMADSPVMTLEDLQGKSVVIGDSDAYEKHYAAKRLFDKKGIRFKRMESTASCIENLGMLMDGNVDAAVISDYALSADCAVDFASPEDFRILASTEKIPLTAVMLDPRKVGSADQARLKAALLDISQSPPDSLLGAGFVEPIVWNPPEQGK